MLVMTNLCELYRKIRSYIAQRLKDRRLNKMLDSQANPQRATLSHTARMERLQRRHTADMDPWDGSLIAFRDLDPPTPGGSVTLWSKADPENRLVMICRKGSVFVGVRPMQLAVYSTAHVLLTGKALNIRDIPRGAKRKFRELYAVMSIMLCDE